MKFTYRVLSLGAAKQADGDGFAGLGEWVLLKCFYEEGEEYGEFFLNLNVNSKEGELAAKEGGYAELLVEAFQRTMRAEVELLESDAAETQKGEEEAPICPIHQVAMISQTGKYGPFWSCHKRTKSGGFCSYRPKGQ